MSGGAVVTKARTQGWRKSRPSAARSPLEQRRTDFTAIAAVSLPYLPVLVARWLPDGRRQGSEWVAKNPTRLDRRMGSFKVNLRSGRWSDFATGDRGGDVISLAAYLFGLTQRDAALKLAEMLGVDGRGAR